MNETPYRNSVVAIFKDVAVAEHARDTLIQNGFRSEQLELTAADDFARDAATGNAALSGRPHHGLGDFFNRLFGNETHPDKEYYSRAMKEGRSALIVHADGEAIDRAADILNDQGAIRLEEGERERALDQNRNEAIPVVNEELRVGKRAVQKGGVRVFSRMTEQPVEQNVPLREEKVRVERRPVNRMATDADLAAAERGMIEVTETSEEPVIEKVARVVEEVVVTKDVRERTENVKGKVRRNDVRVEDTSDTDFRNDFRSRYGDQYQYDEYAPAYRYGYDKASDPRYQGKRYEDIEEDLRTDYMRRNPNSAWDRAKGAVRYGWEKVTGKR